MEEVAAGSLGDPQPALRCLPQAQLSRLSMAHCRLRLTQNLGSNRKSFSVPFVSGVCCFFFF